MKDFTNTSVKKVDRKFKNWLFVGLICYVLAGVLMIVAALSIKEEGTAFLELAKKSKQNEEGFIDVAGEPWNFAYYPGDSAEFYFVIDKDNNVWVTKMKKSTYNKLKKATEEKPIRLTGGTKETPSDIRKLAIDAWNEDLEDDEKLVNADFANMFGTIYLDEEATPFGTMAILVLLGFIIAMGGLGFTLTGAISLFRFRRNIKKLSSEDRKKIDDEMNDKEAFYYAKAQLCLTKNYIVNFASTFEAIPYEDIIWVYKYELRRNGIKTNQSIQVMKKNGKTRAVANLDGISKKSKIIYDEVFETILKNCPQALVGYTSENRKKAKEKIEK